MTKNIALPPIHIVERSKIVVEADYEFTQMLRRYKAYYKEVYAADVADADLVREMARRFMLEDKDFQSHGKKRRRTSRGRTASSSSPPTSSGMSAASPTEAAARPAASGAATAGSVARPATPGQGNRS